MTIKRTIAALRRRTFPLTVGVIVGGIAAGGVAFASIPDTKGVFHACANKQTGVVRVIDTDKGQKCRTQGFGAETPLTWSQAGPRGATGPAGPSGASKGFSASRGSTSGPLTQEGIDVITLTLPAGRYIVTAEVTLENTDTKDASLVLCNIRGGTGMTALTQLQPGTTGHLTRTSWVKMPAAGEVALKCGLGSHLHGDTRRVTSEITAVQVDTLTVEAEGGSPVPV